MSDSKWKRNGKDFVAGTVAGVFQLYSGQPFDIVKIRQATMKEPLGAVATLKQILATEGLKTLWKGTLPPLMGISACISINFGVKENTRRVLESFN